MKNPIVLSLLFGLSLQASAKSFDEAVLTTPKLSPYFNDQSLQQNVVAYGQRASLGSQTRKFTVLLTNNFNAYCTGVLIHPRVIVTNAHCLIDKKVAEEESRIQRATEVHVRFGLNDRDPDGYRVKASEFIISPYYRIMGNEADETASLSPRKDPKVKVDWELFDKEREQIFSLEYPFYYPYGENAMNDNRAQDFALVFLNEPARAPFKPVRMVPSNIPVNLHDQYYVAGFGYPSLDFSDEATWDHFKDPSLGFAKYVYFGRHYMTIGDRQQTIGIWSFPLEEEFFCYGDSGGPVVMEVDGELRLLAVNRSVFDDCTGRVYSFFVLGLTNWIEDQMRQRGIMDRLSL